MVHKIFGLLDLLCVIALIFPVSFDPTFTLLCATYLLIKGLSFLVFSRDLVSLIDIGIGAYLIIAATGTSYLIPTILAIIFLTQKGILSLTN